MAAEIPLEARQVVEGIEDVSQSTLGGKQVTNAATPRTGVYVLANDRVVRWLSAFLGSFRSYNPDLALCLIPFNDASAECEKLVQEAGGFVYRDPGQFHELEAIGAALELGATATGHHWFRRFTAFDGPFERFAYLDCRMVVLAALDRFINAPDAFGVPLVHYDVALNQVYEDGPIRTAFCRDGGGHGFMSGTWASRRGLFSMADMQAAGRELVAVRQQMNRRNTDQFFLNYLCDSHGLRVCHIADLDGRLAHCAWANDRGSIYESSDGLWRKWDFGGLQHKRQMLFVHWAGTRLQPWMPHYFLHQRFRRYRVGPAAAVAERVLRPIGQVGRIARGNRWLNTFYHAYVRREA